MGSSAFGAYKQALIARRLGLDPEVVSKDWVDIKPLFYADSRMLSEAALEVFIGL